LPLRTIRDIAILEDVGPVVFPAHAETTAEVRDAAAAYAMASGEHSDDDRRRLLRLAEFSLPITPVSEADADRDRWLRLAQAETLSFGRRTAAAG
jgi:hypothetical protein